jgi:hypothetical protein
VVKKVISDFNGIIEVKRHDPGRRQCGAHCGYGEDTVRWTGRETDTSIRPSAGQEKRR